MELSADKDEYVDLDDGMILSNDEISLKAGLRRVEDLDDEGIFELSVGAVGS